MASNPTTTANNVIPEVLLPTIQAAFTGAVALYGTGAAQAIPGLTSKIAGTTISFPRWGTLGELQVLNDGVELDTIELTSASTTATVKRAGKAVSLTTWMQMVNSMGENAAYQEVARQFVLGVTRQWDAELIGAAIATDADMTSTVYSATKPVTLNWDVICDARSLYGDEDNDIACLVIHSKVMGDLRKEKDSTGRPMVVLGANGQLTTYQGIPVIVSDRLTASADTPKKYTSLLVKRGALGLAYNGTPSVYVEHQGRTDQDILSINTYYAAHRYDPMPAQTKSGVVIVVSN